MDPKETPATETPTFEQTVNTLTNAMVQGEDGNWTLPEDVAKDLDEPTRYAVMAEKRRKDTQAAFSKSQARIKQLEAENTVVSSEWEKAVVSTLTPEQAEELEELKASDPDTWRTKITEYEEINRKAFGTKKEEVTTAARNETELQRRERLLETFNKDEGIELTDAIIASELPPKFLNTLEETGDFEAFLVSAKDYLVANKVIAVGDKPTHIPDLGKAGGATKPDDAAIANAAKEDYTTEVY